MMAKLAVQTLLIPLLLLLFCIALLVTEVVSKEEAITTSFAYDSFPAQPTDLEYLGDATVPPYPPSLPGGILRLNKAQILTSSKSKPGTELPKVEKWSAGYVLYSKPITFGKTTTPSKLKFQTKIRFSINAVDSEPGDGIAFFITGSFNETYGGRGGNLGIFQNETGTAPGLFAVEFDIFKNAWDPSSFHVGIDVESRESVATRVLESTNLPVNGRVVTATIIYDETYDVIIVEVDTNGQYVRDKTCYFYDLRNLLPDQVYVGISAATGEHVAIHNIHSWHFTSTVVDDD